MVLSDFLTPLRKTCSASKVLKAGQLPPERSACFEDKSSLRAASSGPSPTEGCERRNDFYCVLHLHPTSLKGKGCTKAWTLHENQIGRDTQSSASSKQCPWSMSRSKGCPPDLSETLCTARLSDQSPWAGVMQSTIAQSHRRRPFQCPFSRSSILQKRSLRLVVSPSKGFTASQLRKRKC
jgi:hypothetical protein